MKKLLILLLGILLLLSSAATAEESDAWRTAPVITTAYEMSAGKLYIEWEGNAPVYQVYMDGESVANVIVCNAVINVSKGTHTILVYPISEAKSADTKVDFSLDAKLIGGSFGLDLAALGLDPKNLAAGDPSVPLYIDYTPDQLMSAVPEDLTATTDFDDRVLLSFTDRHYSDEYVVAIRIGKDVTYVRFNPASEEAAALISKKGATVTLTLDPDFLTAQKCMVPELGSKYTFTVQLRKYAEDLVSGAQVGTVVHESKVSKGFAYTPVAAWKTAPVITYASQTADGQIMLQWTHDDNGLGCEYVLFRVKKTFGIRSGVEEIAVVGNRSCIINDLLNGSHSYVIAPRYQGETGAESGQVTVEVQNDWVTAPVISCVQSGSDAVTLTWAATAGVQNYHITVSTGDNDSILRFVDLDFTKHSEFDIPADTEAMEFVFVYDGEIDPEAGEKIRFEVYGVRYAANGEEQKTSTTTQTITIKPLAE